MAIRGLQYEGSMEGLKSIVPRYAQWDSYLGSQQAMEECGCSDLQEISLKVLLYEVWRCYASTF